MEFKRYIVDIRWAKYGLLIKKTMAIRIIVFLFSFCMISCESFLEVDAPKNKLISETVFEDASTVESALANIYFKIREQGMVSGNFGLSISMGAYADELDYYGSDTNQLNLYNHNIAASDVTVSNWWNHAYNLIYAANDIIQGMDNTTTLSLEERNRFKGQALFLRAFLHSLLVGLYGDIPYITTTDYIENNTVPRISQTAVYEEIIKDLNKAVDLLDDTDPSGEHVIPNRSTAKALLARMYLYNGDWQLAGTKAGDLIETHTLETDINKVFLKNSTETLWQLKPGEPGIMNTQEGQRLIITFIPTQGYALTNNLLDAFEPDDLRRSNWIGSITSDDGTTTLHYAYKYKETISSTTESLEYSIVFRLAEQYLIRAEARAHLGDITGALDDLNTIRNRAGLDDITSGIKEGVLDAIIHERQVELFTEHGHRWLDLKRTDKAGQELSTIKPNWQASDILLPIPEAELGVNPNLKPQNPGY